MRCPFCRHPDSRVVDSRTSDDNNVVRRRRECPECGRRFTSYERAVEVGLLVTKKDGRRELFDRAKLMAGMLKACEKRPITEEQLERAADEMERRIRDELADEVPASRIGTVVMGKLREMDEVAYVRFASVYKEFDDTDSFVKEVEGLARENAGPTNSSGQDRARIVESQE